MSRSSKGMVLINGNSHKNLANLVANRLGLPPGAWVVSEKEVDKDYDSDSDEETYFDVNSVCSKPAFNCETKLQIGESVRGKDVFIIQTGTNDPNNSIMELLIMAYASKTSCANRIIAVVPYLPYSRQCKMKKRGAIPSKLIANLMSKSGISHLITMDLHHKEIQGFFNCPVDNLRASSFLIQYLKECGTRFDRVVVVARTPAQARRANAFAERLRCNIAVIHGEGLQPEGDCNDGRSSPPITSGNAAFSPPDFDVGLSYIPCALASDILDESGLNAKFKPPMNIVGNVSNQMAIIVEDLIDDVHPFKQAATLLKENGAISVKVMCTHGLLNHDDMMDVQQSNIDELIITNTIPNDVTGFTKIHQVDVSILLSEAIRRIHYGESMAYLFRNIPSDD